MVIPHHILSTTQIMITSHNDTISSCSQCQVQEQSINKLVMFQFADKHPTIENSNNQYQKLTQNNMNQDQIFRYDELCIDKFKSQCFLSAEITFKVKNNILQKKSVTIYQYYKYQPHVLNLVFPNKYLVLYLGQQEYKVVLKINTDSAYSNYTLRVENGDIVDMYTVFNHYIPLQSNIQQYLQILQENKVLTGFQYQNCKHDNEQQSLGFLEITSKDDIFILNVNNSENYKLKEFNLKHFTIEDLDVSKLEQIKLISNNNQNKHINILINNTNLLIILQILIKIMQCQITLEQYLQLYDNNYHNISIDKYLLSYNKNTNNIIKINPQFSNNIILQHSKYSHITQFIDTFNSLNELYTESYVLFNEQYTLFSYQQPSKFMYLKATCITSDDEECIIECVNNQIYLSLQSQNAKLMISRNELLNREQQFIFNGTQLQIKDHQKVILLIFKTRNDFITLINNIYYLISSEKYLADNFSASVSSFHVLSEVQSLENTEKSNNTLDTIMKIESQIIEVPEKSLDEDIPQEDDKLNVSTILSVEKKSRLGKFSKTISEPKEKKIKKKKKNQ